jgi:hypothetical protein
MKDLSNVGYTIILIPCQDEGGPMSESQVEHLTQEIAEHILRETGSTDIVVGVELKPILRPGSIALITSVMPHHRREFKSLWNYVRALKERFGAVEIWLFRRLA